MNDNSLTCLWHILSLSHSFSSANRNCVKESPKEKKWKIHLYLKRMKSFLWSCQPKKVNSRNKSHLLKNFQLLLMLLIFTIPNLLMPNFYSTFNCLLQNNTKKGQLMQNWMMSARCHANIHDFHSKVQFGQRSRNTHGIHRLNFLRTALKVL